MKRLMEQFIIEITYTELLETDVEELVKLTREYLVKKGFSINQVIDKKRNFELNDPEVYAQVQVLSNDDIIKKFVYSMNNIEICVTKSSISMQVSTGSEYQGFNVYKEYIMYLINMMLEQFGSFISITRVGIRKINSLFIKDINCIENYFSNRLFNCCEINSLIDGNDGTILLSGNRFTMASAINKVNLVTEVQIGNAPERIDGIENIINVYRLILDIDVYWDRELEVFSDMEQKLIDLNATTTCIYNNCLSDVFKNLLASDKDIDDFNIYGGIKKNE